MATPAGRTCSAPTAPRSRTKGRVSPTPHRATHWRRRPSRNSTARQQAEHSRPRHSLHRGPVRAFRSARFRAVWCRLRRWRVRRRCAVGGPKRRASRRSRRHSQLPL